MYVPAAFRIQNWDVLKGFVFQNPFATLVGTGKSGPLAAHIPILPFGKDAEMAASPEDFRLCLHLAGTNPICEVLNTAPPEVLAIFQGPHAYVSGNWYAEADVPTWNYQAVHLSCAVQPLTSETLQEALVEMVLRMEGDAAGQRLLHNLRPGSLEQMARAICGYILTPLRVEASFKLSQNRSGEDRRRVKENLASSQDALAQLLAKQMDEAVL